MELKTRLSPVLSTYNSPLGAIIIIADTCAVKAVFFQDLGITQPAISVGFTEPIRTLTAELDKYFAGKLREFTTPYDIQGTPFQVRVWESLCTISYGTTLSYREQAVIVQKPMGYRAVAAANGANKLAIIVPCHRVINSNGALGGYRGGLMRKRWLLEHEKRYGI